MKSIVITGSSSGIGRATALYFAQQGWKVAATMRQPEKELELGKTPNISLYQLDVSNENSIQEAAKKILADFGELDVLLNNAGYGLMGTFEATTPQQIREQYATNVFGLMETTRAFIPHFRGRKAGTIINISSIGGLMTFPTISLYHSSKWAVEGFSESLSFELGELGIRVKIVEPGGVKTDFAGRSLVFSQKEGLSDYDQTIAKVMKMMQDPDRALTYSSGEDIAKVIYEAATDGKTQLRYLAGSDAKDIAAQRQGAGAEAFVAGMRKEVLG